MQTLRCEVPGSVLAGGSRPGTGPVVVFLHAGVCDRRSWTGVVDALPPDVPALAYDRRGFGESPLGGNPGFRHLDDLRAVLDASTDGPVVLVGSSRGGGLALDAALELGGRVCGVLLLAPAVSGAPSPTVTDLEPCTAELDAAVDDAVAAGRLDRAAELDAQLWLDGPHRPAGAVAGPARELFLAMDGVVLRSGGDGLGGDEVDAWSRLPGLQVPVTVATGDLDCGYLVRRSADLVARVPGARQEDLPGTAHLPFLEAPGAVAAVVTRFLARIS